MPKFNNPFEGGQKSKKTEEDEPFIIEAEDEPLELIEPLEKAPLTKGKEEPAHWPKYKEEDLPFDERESFQKVELFGMKKNKGNFRTNALSDGSYILEFLDKKGERQEMYYFDKKGNLTEFRDPRYDMKEMKDLAGKITKNLQKMNDLMIEMLENDTVYSKITKH